MTKTFARNLHRSLALYVAAGLILLTLTGVLLNHTKSLALNEIHIQSPWLLDWYGQPQPKISQAFSINQHWLSKVNQQLYWDKQSLGLDGDIHQITIYQDIIFVRLNKQIALLTEQGQLIDTMAYPKAVNAPKKTQLLVTEQQLKIIFGEKSWSLNETYSQWIPSNNAPLSHSPLTPEAMPIKNAVNHLPADLKSHLLSSSPSGLTLERIILELHNGYFFGQIGPWLLDVFALLILITLVTGIRLHLKK
jgi:hypothetical protein